MVLKWFITALSIGLFQLAFSNPRYIGSLRKLIIDSDYILYANVVNLEHRKNAKAQNIVEVKLAVKEVLQGNLMLDTIKVSYRPSLVCAATPHYSLGTTVLTFLKKNEAGYLPNPLTCGAKILDSTAYSIYKQSIKAFQSISKIEDKEKQLDQTVDWLIKCAGEPITHWEGAYDLSIHSEFMTIFDPDFRRGFKTISLNDHQKEQLRNVVFNRSVITYEDLGMIDLIKIESDTALVNFLIEKFKQTSLRSLWYRDYFMETIAELSNRDDLKEVIDEIYAISYDDQYREEKTFLLAKIFWSKL